MKYWKSFNLTQSCTVFKSRLVSVLVKLQNNFETITNSGPPLAPKCKNLKQKKNTFTVPGPCSVYLGNRHYGTDTNTIHSYPKTVIYFASYTL